MSGSLESLSNPLERLSVLPTSVQLRLDPLTNSPVWSALIQYFRNDVVISGVNGGAYIFTGGLYDAGPPVVEPLWCLRGGVDPAVDPDGYWQKFTQTGAETALFATPTFTSAGAPPVIVVTANGALTDVASRSVWEAILEYTITWAAPAVAGDLISWQIASNGTGGDTKVVDVIPRVGATVQRGSAVFKVAAGTTPAVPAPVDLTLTGLVAAGTAAITSITGTLSWIRLE